VTKARTGQPPESRRKRIVGLGLPVVLVLGLGVGCWDVVPRDIDHDRLRNL